MSNQLAKEKKISTNAWLSISVGATIVGGIGYWLLLTMTDTYDARQTLDLIGVWAPLVLLIITTSTVASIIAIVKTSAWYKLIPCFLVLVNIAVLALTLLAYALSA